MALWGTPEIIAQQLALTPRFEIANAYLKQAFDTTSAVHARILAVPEGETQRVELGEGVFALEQVYQSKPREEGRLEAHERHVDLQAIVAGEELIEVTTADGLVVTEDALQDRDVCFFADAADVSVWRMRTGEVAVFFPADVHKPSLQISGPAVVHKTVVKVEL
jgi:biofilm protein TabA